MKNCIVIADDDPTILKLVSLRLGMAAYTVLPSGDAQGALAMIRANAPVAAILDVRMPGGGLDTDHDVPADTYTGAASCWTGGTVVSGSYTVTGTSGNQSSSFQCAFLDGPASSIRRKAA